MPLCLSSGSLSLMRILLLQSLCQICSQRLQMLTQSLLWELLTLTVTVLIPLLHLWILRIVQWTFGIHLWLLTFSRRFIITTLQPVAPLINWCLQPMTALSCWWHLQRPGGLVKTMAPLRLTCSLTLRLALRGWLPEVRWLALHTMPLLNMLSSVLDSSTWNRVSGRMV